MLNVLWGHRKRMPKRKQEVWPRLDYVSINICSEDAVHSNMQKWLKQIFPLCFFFPRRISGDLTPCPLLSIPTLHVSSLCESRKLKALFPVHTKQLWWHRKHNGVGVWVLSPTPWRLSVGTGPDPRFPRSFWPRRPSWRLEHTFIVGFV